MPARKRDDEPELTLIEPLDAPKEEAKKEEGKKFTWKMPGLKLLQSGISGAFNAIARVGGSDAEFEPREFEATSRELLNLAEMAPVLIPVLVVLARFSAFQEIFDKVQKFREGKKARAARDAEATSEADIAAQWEEYRQRQQQAGQ